MNNLFILLFLITACTEKPSSEYEPAPVVKKLNIPKFKYNDLVVVKKEACAKDAECSFRNQSKNSSLVKVYYSDSSECPSGISYLLENGRVLCGESLELKK